MRCGKSTGAASRFWRFCAWLSAILCLPKAVLFYLLGAVWAKAYSFGRIQVRVFCTTTQLPAAPTQKCSLWAAALERGDVVLRGQGAEDNYFVRLAGG